MKYIAFIILPFLFWFINLELNPGLKNIWLRTDINGNKVFTPTNVIPLLFYPLKNKQLWALKNWDMNIFILYFISYIMYRIYKHFDKPYTPTEWDEFIHKFY